MKLKKITLIITILLLVTGCGKNMTDDPVKEMEIDDSYIETVPKNAKAFSNLLESNDVLLTLQDIELYNEDIRKRADMMYDIWKNFSKKEILEYINSYKMPSLPKYDGNFAITEYDVNTILDNRNLDNVKDRETCSMGLVVKRANLKSFPTDKHFFNNRKDDNFDNVQETELLVNTPVQIVHESKDKLWYFVITETYTGWVKKEDIAFATKDDIDFFINNKSFAIITEKEVNIDSIILDMSVKLPFIATSEEGYVLVVPTKKDDDFVDRSTIVVNRSLAHIGYLPYTKRNILIQAFKYEGTGYSWSGMDKGVDCSSYVSNVYRTFGFKFPRNTSSQNKSIGKIISLAGKTDQEKLEIIAGYEPALLYQDGHVMIYLGKKDETHYIIHANAMTMKVSVTALSSETNYLHAINKINLMY